MDFKKDIYQDPEIKKYLKQMAQDQRAFVSLANILFTRGLLEDAVEVCKDGLEKNPNFAAGRAVLGKCYHKLGNKENARVEFENTLKINPENVVALKGLGEIYFGLQIYDKSLDMYKRLLFIDPMNDEFKSMIEKTEKALDTQTKLREERLERLKQQNGSEPENVEETVPAETQPSVNESNASSENEITREEIKEDETYQTTFPRSQQPVEESLITNSASEEDRYSAQTQQFSQADIDQLLGAAVTPVAQSQPVAIDTSSQGNTGILEKIAIITTTLIDLYRMAGLNEDADFLLSKLHGSSSADSSEAFTHDGLHSDTVAIQKNIAMQDVFVQEGAAAVESLTPDAGGDSSISQSVGEQQQFETQPVDLNEGVVAATSSDLDDILGSSSADIDALLNTVVPQQGSTSETSNGMPAHIVTEDVLHKDDVSAFEITGAENIRWRQGEDADIEKTIEQSDGILTNDSAAMQMFTQAVNETNVPQAEDMLQPTASFDDELLSQNTTTEPVTELQENAELLPITEEVSETIANDSGSDMTLNSIEGPVTEATDSLPGPDISDLGYSSDTKEVLPQGEINETLNFDEVGSLDIPSSTSQNDPFMLDETVISENTTMEPTESTQLSEETVEEILDTEDASREMSHNTVSETLTTDILSEQPITESIEETEETLTTDENFVPEYRQDAFYSIEDAAQSLTDLQSLMAATEENFTEPVPGEELTVPSTTDDIMDELSNDEALSKEKAASMDFAGASDVMITPNQAEDISQTELEKFSSREELDMTDMLTEQNAVPQEMTQFEGKNELEMEEIHITATAHVPPSDEKNIVSEEIEETIDGNENMSSTFSGKDEVSLGDVSLASQSAPQQSKELNPDTLLLPGMEQKKESVNIDEFLNDTDKKDDMDDINNWLKGL